MHVGRTPGRLLLYCFRVRPEVRPAMGSLLPGYSLGSSKGTVGKCAGTKLLTFAPANPLHPKQVHAHGKPVRRTSRPHPPGRRLRPRPFPRDSGIVPRASPAHRLVYAHGLIAAGCGVVTARERGLRLRPHARYARTLPLLRKLNHHSIIKNNKMPNVPYVPLTFIIYCQ
jgi:hypothetical protein